MNLKEFRLERKLSQKEFLEILKKKGYRGSQPLLSLMEKGERSLNNEFLESVRKAFPDDEIDEIKKNEPYLEKISTILFHKIEKKKPFQIENEEEYAIACGLLGKFLIEKIENDNLPSYQAAQKNLIDAENIESIQLELTERFIKASKYLDDSDHGFKYLYLAIIRFEKGIKTKKSKIREALILGSLSDTQILS